MLRKATSNLDRVTRFDAANIAALPNFVTNIRKC